jgi:transposase
MRSSSGTKCAVPFSGGQAEFSGIAADAVGHLRAIADQSIPDADRLAQRFRVRRIACTDGDRDRSLWCQPSFGKATPIVRPYGEADRIVAGQAVSQTQQERRHRASDRSGAVLLGMKAPDATQFRSGRQFAALIGLMPKDHSTAGKIRL